ncbi:hypothetical protein EDB62_11250 [Vibrio crassostreae]|uniref:hypothetical protein n=1 Tax=Vibrio crassostreae TaxID=246167 RepID=UPI00104336E3|nr:hypothetical protein [Vibrio crassostreae]TCN75783.1 hypothetical protein EDB62_11250 [Vibrio crassostreae]TWD72110.1 hypothetical protein FB445_10350 [Vibrio crassostreae]
MKNEKPLWIIGSLLSLLLLPAVFIAGLITGQELSNELPLSEDSLSAWVAALATVAIAVLTFILALETWKLRRSQDKQSADLIEQSIKPELEIYLESSRISFQFMNLYIENTGNGVAKDIIFNIKGRDGLNYSSEEKALVDEFERLNFIQNNMASLGVQKKRSSFLFSFIELVKKVGNSAFDIKLIVEVSFTNISGKRYTSESIVDLSEFKGITELGNGDPVQNLSNEVEKIRKSFESVVHSGGQNKNFNVRIHTKRDVEDRRKKEVEMLEEYNRVTKS